MAFSRLGSGRYGVRRAGDFSGRGEYAVPAVARGLGVASAVASLVIIAAGISVGGSNAAAFAAPLKKGVGVAVGQGSVRAVTEGEGQRNLDTITRLVVNGWGSRRTGYFARNPFLPEVGTGVAHGAGSAPAEGLVTSLGDAVAMGAGVAPGVSESVSTVTQDGVAFGGASVRGVAIPLIEATAEAVGGAAGSTAEDATGIASASGIGVSYGVGSAAGTARYLLRADGVASGAASTRATGAPQAVYVFTGVSVAGGHAIATATRHVMATGVSVGGGAAPGALIAATGLSDDRRYYVVAEVRVYYVT